MLFGFSFVSYLERVNISIAAELMMPALSLTKTQMGQIFSSFLIGYAIFQVPGGILGDFKGPRFTLALAALFWGITTVLTGMIPGGVVKSSAGIFFSLWIVRFLLGSAEAATYPVSARSVRNWMPAPKRAMGNSVMLAGGSLAPGLTAPLFSWFMVRVGWRESFYLTSIPAFLIAILWYWYVTDHPGQHRHVNSGELALIRNGESGVELRPSFPRWRLLADRKILFLSLSYIAEGYVLFLFVFWLYIYLVDVRGFTILKGGMVASLPWFTAVAFTPLGGISCDFISARRGRLAGPRWVIMTGYGLSGALLFAAAEASSRTIAVGALCLSVGFLYFAEPAFWTTAVFLSGENAGAVSGIMNTAGIVGGILSTSLVPVLVKHFGWLTALSSGAAMALLCSVSWCMFGRESPSTSHSVDIKPNASPLQP
jgi:ACS family glucarate transporter-like MFS transporter